MYKSHSLKHTYSVSFLLKHTFKRQWIHRVQDFAQGYFSIDIRRVRDWSTDLPTDRWPALRKSYICLSQHYNNVAGNSSVFLSSYFLRSVLVFDQICLSQVGNNLKGGLVGPVNYVAVSPDSGKNNRLKVQYSLKSFKSNYLLYARTHITNPWLLLITIYLYEFPCFCFEFTRLKAYGFVHLYFPC